MKRRPAKHNTYTPGQRALLGKYVVEHGATAAAFHYSNINELTARRLKCQYLEKIKEIAHSSSRDAYVEVTALTTKEKGRPLLLEKNLDDLVKEWIENLRILGGIMNTTVVMAGAQGIILSRDATKLQLHGGHINITKSWARSLLISMGFFKRKCSNAGKVCTC